MDTDCLLEKPKCSLVRVVYLKTANNLCEILQIVVLCHLSVFMLKPIFHMYVSFDFPTAKTCPFGFCDAFFTVILFEISLVAWCWAVHAVKITVMLKNSVLIFYKNRVYEITLSRLISWLCTMKIVFSQFSKHYFKLSRYFTFLIFLLFWINTNSNKYKCKNTNLSSI